MAELLKNVYDQEYVERLGQALKAEHSSFNVQAFVSSVFDAKWEVRELKDRMYHIRACLHKHLDMDYERALGVIEVAGKDFNGYAGMLFPDFVQTYGLKNWERSINSLEVLTVFSSSEFAIRPFIRLDPVKGMKQMLAWSKHENEHVRRLASEGCRPRLPWASALTFLKQDPLPILPILENLKADESLYVRKSVANNLNDISKDHPKIAIEVAQKWMKKPHDHTRWIVKHGMRTLLKAGHKDVLKLFGYGDPKSFSDVNFMVKNPLVIVGDKLNVEINFSLKKSSLVRLEYALHFLLKNGTWGRKVFKISEKEMEQGQYTVEKAHLLKKMTTRTLYDGVQAFELILNGESFGTKPFALWTQTSPYQVYMLETMRGTFYSGVTTDMNRRFAEHLGLVKGGAKFTKAQKPHALIYLEAAENRSSAQKRESALKKLTKKQKLKLLGHSFISSS